MMNSESDTSSGSQQDEPVTVAVLGVNNLFKSATIVLSLVIVGLLAVLGYVLATTIFSPKVTAANTQYTVNLAPEGLRTPDSGVTPSVLSLNDLSDSFADKYFSIDEWGLSIKTKYADLLEYSYEERGASWGSDTSPYGACNGTYLYCDSVVTVKLKEQYATYTADEKTMDAAAKAELRTIARIFQDNRSLSQSGEVKARYWENNRFETEYGIQGTLIFEQNTPKGIDTVGKAACGVELTVFLIGDAPCDDIFLSLYKFDLL